jgi:aldose 1-epimerase
VQYRRVTDNRPGPSEPETILTLHAEDATVTVHPDAGARIGQITVSGQPLLVDAPPPDDRQATAWGAYPMAPWAGRIARGRFVFDGVERRLPINHHDGDGPERAHAIHGLAFDRAWKVVEVDDTGCTCRCDLAWEFGGVAEQRIEVFADHVVTTLSVASTGSRFPAEIGWHPWFRKPDRLEFAPIEMYERDEFGIPTGALVEPTPGPWDDCFTNTLPVTLQYHRAAAATVTVSSDCDHVVVYDEQPGATCVEPQSGPPDAFNLGSHVVDPATSLQRTMTISW